MLHFFGLVRYKDEKYQRLQVLKGYLVLLFWLMFNFTQYFYIFDNRNDLVRVATRGGSLFMFSSLLIKGITTLLYHDKYCEILNNFDMTLKEIQQSDDIEIQQIMSKFFKRNAFMTKLVVGSTACTTIIFNVYIMLNLLIFFK